MILCDRLMGDHIGWHLVSRFPILKAVSGKYVPITEIEMSYIKTSDPLYRKGWFDKALEAGLYLNRGDFIHIVQFNSKGDLVLGPVVAKSSQPTVLQKVTATLRKL